MGSIRGIHGRNIYHAVGNERMRLRGMIFGVMAILAKRKKWGE
jgi:hypothetical protein